MALKPRFLKIWRRARFYALAARIIVTADEKARTFRSVVAIKRAIES